MIQQIPARKRQRQKKKYKNIRIRDTIAPPDLNGVDRFVFPFVGISLIAVRGAAASGAAGKEKADGGSYPVKNVRAPW